MSLNPISTGLLPQEGIEFKRNISLQTKSVNENMEPEFQSENEIESKKNPSFPMKTTNKVINPENEQLLVKPK